MNTPATLKSISKLLDLSISTVSRALKDHPDISVATKKRVLELATSLDYEPNTLALNLRMQRSKAYGVIVPHIANQFYASFIGSLERLVRKAGFSLVTFQTNDDAMDELSIVRKCQLYRLSGLFAAITPNTQNLKPFQQLIEAGTPVIFFDKVPEADACHKVCVGDEDAARLAANELILAGKKKVLAIFGNPWLSITRKRLAAFEAHFNYHSPTTQLHIIHVSSKQEARDMVHKHFFDSHQPDSIFTMSDEILAGAMKAIQQLGLIIPTQVGIISISNDGYIPGLYTPEINYVTTNADELVREAFALMQSLHEGNKEFRTSIIPSRFIKGKSL